MFNKIKQMLDNALVFIDYNKNKDIVHTKEYHDTQMNILFGALEGNK